MNVFLGDLDRLAPCPGEKLIDRREVIRNRS